MHNHNTPYTSGPQENERCIPPKDSRIAELYKTSYQRRCQWRERVSEGKLVEVMDMCYTEVERSGKYNGSRGGKWSNEEMEGYEKGAEEEFFVCRTDDEVSPADPAA